MYFKLLVLKTGCCKGLINKDKQIVLIVLLVCILNVDSKWARNLFDFQKKADLQHLCAPIVRYASISIKINIATARAKTRQNKIKEKAYETREHRE